MNDILVTINLREDEDELEWEFGPCSLAEFFTENQIPETERETIRESLAKQGVWKGKSVEVRPYVRPQN